MDQFLGMSIVLFGDLVDWIWSVTIPNLYSIALQANKVSILWSLSYTSVFYLSLCDLIILTSD